MGEGVWLGGRGGGGGGRSRLGVHVVVKPTPTKGLPRKICEGTGREKTREGLQDSDG